MRKEEVFREKSACKNPIEVRKVAIHEIPGVSIVVYQDTGFWNKVRKIFPANGESYMEIKVGELEDGKPVNKFYHLGKLKACHWVDIEEARPKPVIKVESKAVIKSQLVV